MGELQKRIAKVESALEDAKNCVERHGRNGLSSLDNLGRLVADLKDWVGHIESAATCGAVPIIEADGQITYSRPD